MNQGNGRIWRLGAPLWDPAGWPGRGGAGILTGARCCGGCPGEPPGGPARGSPRWQRSRYTWWGRRRRGASSGRSPELRPAPGGRAWWRRPLSAQGPWCAGARARRRLPRRGKTREAHGGAGEHDRPGERAVELAWRRSELGAQAHGARAEQGAPGGGDGSSSIGGATAAPLRIS